MLEYIIVHFICQWERLAWYSRYLLLSLTCVDVWDLYRDKNRYNRQSLFQISKFSPDFRSWMRWFRSRYHYVPNIVLPITKHTIQILIPKPSPSQSIQCSGQVPHFPHSSNQRPTSCIKSTTSWYLPWHRPSYFVVELGTKYSHQYLPSYFET